MASSTLDKSLRRAPIVPVAPQSFSVLGTRIDLLTMDRAIQSVREFVKDSIKANLAFCTASTVLEARRDPQLRAALSSARLVAPDGMPLVWLGRRSKEGAVERVYGPDFMLVLLASTGARYRHFFYGGAPGVAAEMAIRLQRRFPDLVVAGIHSPPKISDPSVIGSDVDVINRAQPDIVWVGLGHPKQEIWMHAHRDVLNAPVLAGVGAAFDFLSGRKKEAPGWMKRSGLQWLHRLASEPRRLWRRYLIGNTTFALLVAREMLSRRPRSDSR